MIVLVCGGRHYADRVRVFAVLDAAHAMHGFTLLVHGAATGADTLADAWAKARGVPRKPYPVTRAEWKRLGLRAGPIRNAAMLAKEKPQLGIAFPGGSGTADMVEKLEAAGVEVINVE
jgi:hypothetical protein